MCGKMQILELKKVLVQHNHCRYCASSGNCLFLLLLLFLPQLETVSVVVVSSVPYCTVPTLLCVVFCCHVSHFEK